MLENDHFEALAKERLANLTIGDRFSIGARYFKKGVRLMGGDAVFDMVAGILENRRSQIIDERPHQYGRAREKLFDISARAAELIPMSRAHDLAQGMRQRIAYIQEDRGVLVANRGRTFRDPLSGEITGTYNQHYLEGIAGMRHMVAEQRALRDRQKAA